MTNHSNTDDFDVVIDTLQSKITLFQKMIQQNMNADMFNIMDEIRLEQITELEAAIKHHRSRTTFEYESR